MIRSHDPCNVPVVTLQAPGSHGSLTDDSDSVSNLQDRRIMTPDFSKKVWGVRRVICESPESCSNKSNLHTTTWVMALGGLFTLSVYSHRPRTCGWRHAKRSACTASPALHHPARRSTQKHFTSSSGTGCVVGRACARSARGRPPSGRATSDRLLLGKAVGLGVLAHADGLGGDLDKLALAVNVRLGPRAGERDGASRRGPQGWRRAEQVR